VKRKRWPGREELQGKNEEREELVGPYEGGAANQK